jgi:hypothetical protein
MRPLFIALLTSISICACSGGGGSSSSSGDRVAVELADIASAPENENAYSMVLGIPFVSSSTVDTIYDHLISNLNSPQAQAKLPIARVLLSTVAPNNNGVFTIDASNPSRSMTFLQEIISYNAGKPPANQIQILAYPDVEASSPWASWPVPAFAQSIKSCKLGLATTDPNAQSQRAMLLSICWASAMNLALKSNVIAGVVFDQQSNWIKTTNPDTYIPWTSTQARNDNLLIGWISGNGIAPSAGNIDLNFIEIYDLDSNKGPYYDTVAPPTVLKGSPNQFLPPSSYTAGKTCTGLLCAYSSGYAYSIGNHYLDFFPGPQYTYGATGSVIGAVGANIYQCAISQNLSDDLCTSAYSDNVDITQAPSVQIMQAVNYVKGGTPKAIPPTTNKYPLWGQANSLSGNVIYLFSTQYVGPLKSYFGTNPLQSSQNRCADPSAPAHSCSCIASKYSPNAFCGEENGFGTWGNYFSEFAKFTALFLGSQGGKNCPGNSCSAGIYMYDYIPQAWYSQ